MTALYHFVGLLCSNENRTKRCSSQPAMNRHNNGEKERARGCCRNKFYNNTVALVQGVATSIGDEQEELQVFTMRLLFEGLRMD